VCAYRKERDGYHNTPVLRIPEGVDCVAEGANLLLVWLADTTNLSFGRHDGTVEDGGICGGAVNVV
jgi:hypothetical protein